MNGLAPRNTADATRIFLDRLRAEVGVRENYVDGHYNNLGVKVEQYQRADTLPGIGYAWCASLMAYGFLTGFGKPLCDAIWNRTASCDTLLGFGRQREILSDTPIPGCVGLVINPNNPNDATHTFGVEELLGPEIQTIEGNTNVDGSREGNGVYRRKRVRGPRYRYLHWQRLLPASWAIAPPATPLPPRKNAPLSPFQNAHTINLFLGGNDVDDIPVVDGRAWVPAWKWAHWMGDAKLGWNIESQTVTIGGREIAKQPILWENRAWLPVRDLVAFSGLECEPVPGGAHVFRKAQPQSQAQSQAQKQATVGVTA